MILTPYFSEAAPILRSAETISIDATQSLEGDFYGVAQSISISGAAQHDLYLGGLNVTINAPVQQDLVVIGGSVQVHDEVGDDVRLLAGDATISERVKGDVVVYAGKLHILSTAHIEGDLIYSGEELRVEGPVDGNIHGLSKKIRVDAVVGGDIQYVALESFSLGENAEIKGSISYESNYELARNTNAVIHGEIYQTSILPDSGSDSLESFVFMLFIILFASMTLYLLGKRYVQPLVVSTTRSFGQNGLIGLAILLLTPFVSFIFMVSVIGVFVGVILLLSWFVVLIAAFVFVSVVFGFHVQKLIIKKTTVTIQTLIIGSITLGIALLIPVVGPLLVIATTLVVLGSFCRHIYSFLRR